ncbi:hypothetical protein RJT34_03337 [Clitoria ternatea]|uniref:Uncharacterized protein n=1 Tax=Clitoria ternatea TaxID=43366 RepID=A0AAN9Q2G0_CLITE
MVCDFTNSSHNIVDILPHITEPTPQEDYDLENQTIPIPNSANALILAPIKSLSDHDSTIINSIFISYNSIPIGPFFVPFAGVILVNIHVSIVSKPCMASSMDFPWFNLFSSKYSLLGHEFAVNKTILSSCKFIMNHRPHATPNQLGFHRDAFFPMIEIAPESMLFRGPNDLLHFTMRLMDRIILLAITLTGITNKLHKYVLHIFPWDLDPCLQLHNCLRIICKELSDATGGFDNEK